MAPMDLLEPFRRARVAHSLKQTQGIVNCAELVTDSPVASSL